MSSCLSGGGRAYRLELEIIKSPTNSWTSNSSSPLSESTNSPLTISTRKARTPRKRPNQTYNEAAAILSTAYPKIFPTKNLTKSCKFTDISRSPFLFESSNLLMPFQVIDKSRYLLLKRLNPLEKPCQSPIEIKSVEICKENQEDEFDAESILDEEIEEGIDSIMGNLSMENERIEDSSNICSSMQMNSCCYGYPVGLGFDFGYGMIRERRSMRNVDEGDWWRFPSVNVKKSKKKNPESSKENSASKSNAGLLLKLNYEDVLNAWSEKGSPFSGDAPGEEFAGKDVQARLAQIDLFPENGGGRGAIVLRCKEKRRTRLISKKIRYQVKKVNADQRTRMKGIVVRKQNSTDD